MHSGRYDHGFGEVWKDVFVYRKEAYTTSVADYHAHAYYEINLIFSGNINILLPGRSLETNRPHLILTGPGVPHYISCNRDTLYSRLYLNFTADFLKDTLPQAPELLEVFGKEGWIVPLSHSRVELCRDLIERIEKEKNHLRKKMLTLYLLSCIGDFARNTDIPANPVPLYILEALSYIEHHYNRKILASDLADQLHIGRTTLMTAFKKYTGSTLNDYLIRYRINAAKSLLRQGVSVQETAERCGFGDSSGLIRCFRKYMGTTPGAFLRDKA